MKTCLIWYFINTLTHFTFHRQEWTFKFLSVITTTFGSNFYCKATSNMHNFNAVVQHTDDLVFGSWIKARLHLHLVTGRQWEQHLADRSHDILDLLKFEYLVLLCKLYFMSDFIWLKIKLFMLVCLLVLCLNDIFDRLIMSCMYLTS